MRRLIRIAFDPPLPCTKSAVLIRRWAPGDRRRRFIVETLAAYGELQRAVAAEVISLERQARALTGEIKVTRRARDRVSATVLEQKIATVRRRQLIVRRMMDAVMYILCDQYVWFIRRLALHDHVQPVDPDNLGGTHSLMGNAGPGV